jgi:hypothetical protein
VAGPPQAPAAGGQPADPAAAPPPAPVAGWSAPPATSAAAPSLEDALGALKTAALAARGAHLNYLRFSERELAAASESDATGGYSEEYVSAWFTLADAVASLREARAAATAAAGAAGMTLDLACASRPDLAHLLGELQPYAAAESDEDIHAAFLAVARAGTPGS